MNAVASGGHGPEPACRAIRAIRAAGALLIAIAGAMSGTALAQDAPRFRIERFEIEGESPIPLPELTRLVMPHTGADRDFGDIERARDTLETALRAAGFGVVRVLLPEQDITRGTVRIRIAAPRVGRVAVEGHRHVTPEQVRRTLPALQEGTVPNERAIARELHLLSEQPGRETNVVLRAGER